MTDHTPMLLERYLNLLYRKDMAFTLQPLLCKGSYRLVSVQCLNSTQNSAIMTKVLEAVLSGFSIGHPDRTEAYFRLQIQCNQKLIPCFRTF